MFRKLIFVLCAMSLTLASCGRQVTPNRPGTSGQGLQPGYMQIKFNTYQAMDFTNVWYVLAFNTDGSGQQPYPFNGNDAQNWLGYSFEIIVYQLQGQSSPTAALVQFVSQTNPGGGPSLKRPTPPLPYNQQSLIVTPNCNGSGTQFCITIDRHLFSGLAGSTSTPSPSPSSSASPVPPAISGIWNINWFTVQPTTLGGEGAGQVIDAPGPQGASDLQWLPPNRTYDTSKSFDLPWNAVPPPGWPQVQNQAAQIAGGEVLNNP